MKLQYPIFMGLIGEISSQTLACDAVKSFYQSVSLKSGGTGCCASPGESFDVHSCVADKSDIDKLLTSTHHDAFLNLGTTSPPTKGSTYWNSMTHDNNPDFSGLIGLKNKMSTLAIGQVAPPAAGSKKTTFRSIADDDFLYVNHVDGYKVGSVITALDGIGNYGIDSETYKPWDVSYDHGEGEATTIAKYDKWTLSTVAVKSMREMWEEYMGSNVDSKGNTYPMNAPWGYKDNNGVHRPQISGPFVTCRGPLTQHGDSLYIFNSDYDKLTLARVSKADLNIKYAIENTDGERENNPSFLWGKGLTVIPASDTTSTHDHLRYPKICISTSSHVLYEGVGYSSYVKQPNFTFINEGLWSVTDDETNGKLICYYDTGSSFKKAWEFSTAPRHLAPGDKLPASVFPDDADFYRVYYDSSLLKGMSVKARSDTSSHTALAGVNRVLLKPPKRSATVTQFAPQQFSVNRTWEDPEKGITGYIRLNASQMLEDSLMLDVFSDIALTKCVTEESAVAVQKTDTVFAGDDMFRVNSNGCVSVSFGYLAMVRHPLIYTLKRSGVNVLTLDKQLAFSLNWYGGSMWMGSAGYDSGSDSLFITTGQTQSVPLEEDIRNLRALAAKDKSSSEVGADWVEAGMGLTNQVVPPEYGVYGSELNIFTGSGIDTANDLRVERAGEGIWQVSRDAFNEYLASPTPDLYDKAVKARAVKGHAMVNFQTRIIRSPRSRRHVGNGGFAAIDAKTGGFLWGLATTPHRGLIDRNRMYKSRALFLFTGANLDNAEGPVVSTEHRRAVTMTQKSTDMWAFNLTTKYSAPSVLSTCASDDNSTACVDKRDGVSEMKIPFIVGEGSDGDLMRSEPGPSGVSHAYGSNLITTDAPQTESLEQYWGVSGYDSKGHFLTANTYVGTVTNTSTTLIANEETTAQVVDSNGITSSARGAWYHQPSVGLIDIAVYDALTMKKKHDILFYQPEPAMYSGSMSIKGFTILPDDTVTWGDGTNEVVILNYMTGKVVKRINLAEDHSNPVGPIVSNSKLFVVGTKAQRFSGTEFGATPKDALIYGITPFGVANAGP